MKRRGSSGIQGTGPQTRSLLLLRRKCDNSWRVETFSERSHDSGREETNWLCYQVNHNNFGLKVLKADDKWRLGSGVSVRDPWGRSWALRWAGTWWNSSGRLSRAACWVKMASERWNSVKVLGPARSHVIGWHKLFIPLWLAHSARASCQSRISGTPSDKELHRFFKVCIKNSPFHLTYK